MQTMVLVRLEDGGRARSYPVHAYRLAGIPQGEREVAFVKIRSRAWVMKAIPGKALQTSGVAAVANSVDEAIVLLEALRASSGSDSQDGETA